MGLTTVMVALHPKAWRERYGEEFTALLEDTGLTPRAVADVLAGAARLHAQHHRRALSIVVALLVSGGSATTAKLTGQGPNLLWLPRTLPSGLLLLGVLGPWLALAVSLRNLRSRARQEADL